MEHIILQGIKLEDFLYQIEKTIEKKVNETLEHLKQKDDWRYITRAEAAKILKITLPTLHNYILEGRVISYRIGKRILIRTDELESAVIKRNFRTRY